MRRRYEEGERFRGVALDEALNRSGRTADAGVRYAITALTTLNVTAGYEEQTFDESHIRDLKRYTVGPTLEFSPEAAIRGRVVTAFELFKPNDPELGEQMGLAYQAQLNWSLYGRTLFDLGAGRNISYSYLDTEPYYLLTNARLTRDPAAYRDGSSSMAAFDWEHMAYRWRRGIAAAPGESDRVDTADRGTWRRRHTLRARLSDEDRRRKDTTAFGRRTAAEFQAHADLEYRDDGFVRNATMAPLLVTSDRPRRRMHARVRAGGAAGLCHVTCGEAACAGSASVA